MYIEIFAVLCCCFYGRESVREHSITKQLVDKNFISSYIIDRIIMKLKIGILGLLSATILIITGCTTTTTTVAPVVITTTSTVTATPLTTTVTNPVLFIVTTTTTTTTTVTVTQALPTTPPSTTATPTQNPTQSSVQTSSLTFVSPVNLPSTEYAVVYEPMLDEIQQNSEGRITFNIFTYGSIGPRSYQYDAVRTGVVDMGVTYFGDIADKFPLYAAFTFPAEYEVTNLGEDLIQGLGNRIVYTAPDETKVLCFFWHQPFYLYTSNKQVKSLENIKGLKIVANFPLQASVVTALGAVPISLSQADILLAGERGLIDGILATPGMMDTYGLTGVFKYALGFPLGYNVGMINLNANTWMTLSEDIKTVMEQAAIKARYNFVQQYNNDNTRVNGILTSSGGAVYNLTAYEQVRWLNAIKPVFSDWVADMESKGLPATDLLDDIRVECQKLGIAFPY